MIEPLELPGPAHTMTAEYKRRMKEWNGLRYSKRTACPTTILGRHTRGWDPDCLCQKHQRILDHSSSWTDKEGRRVVTSEPYDASGTDISELVRDCKKLGLRVRVQSNSPYYPMRTLLIVIREDGLR